MRFYLNIFVFYLSLIPLAFLHECGHALVGRILGFRIFWISIGYGRQVFESRILGFSFRVNSFPFGGETALATRSRVFFRLRSWLATFAGPATHLALVWACFYLLGADYVRERLFSFSTLGRIAPVEMFIYANLLLLLINLFPIRIQGTVGLTYNDGSKLLGIPFLRDEDIEESMVAYYSLDAEEHMRSGQTERAISLYEDAIRLNPQSYMLRNDLAIARLGQGDYEHAREEFVNLIESVESLRGERRALLLNNIAWANVVLGREELLAEADSYSEEAFKFAPKVTSFIGTRGAVMVMTGRVDEGLGLLKTAFEQHSEQEPRGSVACWIAIGTALIGDFTESANWLQRAREESPDPYLLEQAKQKIREWRYHADKSHLAN